MVRGSSARLRRGPTASGPAIFLATCLLGALLGCAAGARDPARPVEAPSLVVVVSAQQATRVMDVLDQYMNALNQLDMEAHVATYHFPHYRHASGQVVVWQSAREAMPILDVPVEERRAALRRLLEPDWDRSEWTRRDIVQASPDKVHLATQFVRLRKDGSVIKTFDSLYVLTLEDGRWGIRGRSSFAP